jgi:hypothetical protein
MSGAEVLDAVPERWRLAASADVIRVERLHRGR